MEGARTRGFRAAEAGHWCVCSLLPFSAWGWGGGGGGSSIVVMATDLESKGQQIWCSDLSPACWYVRGQAGTRLRERIMSKSFAVNPRAGERASSHTCTSIPPRVFPQSTRGGAGTPRLLCEGPGPCCSQNLQLVRLFGLRTC